MKLPHDNFCVLPWLSLETSPIGSIRPCCLAEEEIVDNQGDKFDLATASLNDVQNSAYMIKLREEFLQEKKPRTCRKCWNEERAGRTSKRMHTLDRLRNVIDYTEWSTESKPLMFLDLKLGNICNLKCRICGSWSSSSFATEELNFIGKDQDKKSSFHYQMLKKGAWPRENIKFWSEIDKILTQIQYIEFTGGEPFMIKEHFDLLQKIVDKGISKNVEIHYNTNGTHWPESAIDIWKHFKTVEIAFSIDNLESRFEYERTNANWQKVLDNLHKFQLLRSAHSNIQLQVCSTVNVFNVLYLESLANWIDKQNFNFVYWNMLHESYYFSVGTLPQPAKDLATEVLKKANVAPDHKQEFARIIDFMNKGVSLDGNILRMKILDLDRKRNQDLKSTHQELATVLDYEFKN